MSVVGSSVAGMDDAAGSQSPWEIPTGGVNAAGRCADGSDGEPPEVGLSWLDELVEPELGPASWLGELPVSSQLMHELEVLPAEVVADDWDAVEIVSHWARLEAYCAAMKRLTAAAVAQRPGLAHGLSGLDSMGITVRDPSVAADELALRLGVTRRAATRLIRSGRALTGQAVLVGEAFLAGEVDATKADLIVDAITDLGADAALAVQEQVLPVATGQPAPVVRRALATACAEVDPEEFEDRYQRAAAQRRVDRPRVLPHGMASLYAVLPAVAATRLYRAVDAAARSAASEGDPRSMDQLRADALAAMGATAIGTGWIGTPPQDAPEQQEPPPVPSDDPGAGPEQDSAFTAATDPGRCADAPDPAPPPPPGASPGEGGELERFRVGVIGGRSAQVRVLVPLTVLMDTPEPAGQPPTTAQPAAAGSDPPTMGADPPHTDDPAPHVVGGVCPPGAGAGSLPGTESGAGPAKAARACPPESGVDRSPEATTTAAVVADAADAPPVADAAGAPAVPEGADAPVAVLEGYGPIPASVARALAAGGIWTRLVTDPLSGAVREIGTHRYRPPQALADLVRATSPRCRRPGCGIASDSCDPHHRIPWPEGTTMAENLDPLCRRDHLLITHAGWNYTERPDTTRTWTTSSGHRYQEQPDGAVVPVRRSPTSTGPPPY